MGFLLKKPCGKDTARFVATGISTDPKQPITLIVRHAGRGNDAFVSATAKIDRSAVGDGASPAQRQLAREMDAGVFARTVVTAWENVVEDGQPAACEPEVVERFLLQWIQPRQGGEADADYAERMNEFDRLRLYVVSVANFRDPVTPPEQLGKG